MNERTQQERIATIETLLEKKYVQLLFDHDRAVRSHIIYEAAAIDGLVADIIALHFCPDEEKHLSFKGLMFNTAEVSFKKKIDILGKLLKSHYPDILKDIPGLIKSINSVRDDRNDFAHKELILDEDKIKKIPEGIGLRSIDRNGKVVDRFIPSAEADRLVRSAQTVKWYVFYVWLELQHRTKGHAPNQFRELLDSIKSGLWDSLIENSGETGRTQVRKSGTSVPPKDEAALSK